MYWNVVEVIPESDHRLLVRFKDGLHGQVRLRVEDLTGALEPLRDIHFFWPRLHRPRRGCVAR